MLSPQTGFLTGHQANGAFVACGPPGFTALALLSLGEEAQTMYVFEVSFSTSLHNLIIHMTVSPHTA